MLLDQGRKLMSHVIDWKSEIGTVAGPFLPTDTKQSWLSRAANRCSISVRHITSLYYGHVKDPKYSVATRVLSAADRARLDEARRNVEKVTTLYRVHAEKLSAIDQNLHREQVDALLCAARILGERDSA